MLLQPRTGHSAACQRPHRRKAGAAISALAFLLLSPAANGAFLTPSPAAIGAPPGNSARESKAMRPAAQAMRRARARSRPTGGRRAVSSAAENGEAGASSFYQRLNSPRHVLAPMVAQSDLPFRLMCEHLFDVDLSYTQMIHGSNFVQSNGEIFRTNHLDVYPPSTVGDILLGKEDGRTLWVTPSQVNALKGLTENELEQSRRRILDAVAESKGSMASFDPISEVKPTIVQIAAHDPDVAVEAAMMILQRSGTMESRNSASTPVAAIDLNLGCPQSIARKGCYGSFLHDESPELTYSVLTKLRSKLPPEIGVTAKIRLPPTQSDADAGRLGNISTMTHPQTVDERMRCLIDCGVDLITVHGRTRFKNKVAVGAADWDAIRRCAASARAHSGDERYPIFANGGIESREDVTKCFDETTASGVMSSEGALEVPGLFLSGDRGTPGSITARALFERQLGYADVYLDYATVFPPLPGSLGARGGSFNVIRSHVFKFVHRYLEENPDLRSSLGDQEMNTIKQVRCLLLNLRSRYEQIGEEELRAKKSWNDDSSWYRRHRRQDARPENGSSALSLEERKELAKLRIQKMQEKRMKRLIKTG